MDELIGTDVGLISKDNANWLYHQNILDEKGGIRAVLVKGMVNKKVYLYSYFREIVGDVKGTIPTPPRQIGLGLNEIVELMRTGSISIKYKVGDDEYTYKAEYPRVEKIYDTGRKIFLERLPKKKGDIDLDGWD